MPSAPDKPKRWQFGTADIAWAVVAICASLATMQLGVGAVVVLVPLYFVIFLAAIGRVNAACLLLLFWLPIGGLVAFALFTG